MGKQDKAAKPVLFKKRDLVFVAVLLLAAVGLWFVVGRGGEPGAYAKVTVGFTGSQQVVQVPLDKDGVTDIAGADGITAHLEVVDGQIRFINAECPDHVCEGFGWLHRDGEWASCLPAGVVIQVVDDTAE